MTTENNSQEEIVAPEVSETETVEVETVSVPKTDYDKLNQTVGSLKRELKDLKKPKEEVVTTTSKGEEKKSESLGYAEKAFLIANGIKGADEIGLVEKAMKSTGDTLDQVIENEFFQGKLKGMRDAKAASTAVPSGTKRSAQQPATDTVEYWSEKYNSGTPLTDIPDEMQIKVLNAKIAKEKSSGSNFTKNPVISG